MSSTYTDSQGRPLIAVTGAGMVTSLGAGKAENWASLTAGKSGIHRITRFPVEGLRTTIGGTIDFVEVEPLTVPDLSEKLAAMTGEEALQQSGLEIGDFPGPLFMAIPPIEVEWPQRTELARATNVRPVTYPAILDIANRYPQHHARFMFGGIAERTAERFGTKGAPISLTTACASGATAIQLGVEAIRRGETEAALVIASDASMTSESMIRFSLLSALSTQNEKPEGASRPFSKNRDGFVMAEGAAALVLESAEHAHRRGAKILGYIAGVGERADGFHRTRSNPDGKAIIAAMNLALADSGVSPDDIDYINAHGTGTPENDKMESLGVSTVFGERIREIPISSNKSMIGHTLTAAGAIEAVISLLTIEHQCVPPTINYNEPDPTIELDVVPFKARQHRVRHILSNSFGFGGQNACVVLSAEPA
ncbi:MAG: beta-ketoacyl-ACP synthase [Rhodobiaceae bacterium]|nr:beta-ketoacyl-ACP synthase [Rhodobiaceae bacterium]MCC0057208.1 beta-ketoacyl-ACP synthase [Rhodobiaceae bacterium]